jgi:hypothetical protein
VTNCYVSFLLIAIKASSWLNWHTKLYSQTRQGELAAEKQHVIASQFAGHLVVCLFLIHQFKSNTSLSCKFVYMLPPMLNNNEATRIVLVQFSLNHASFGEIICKILLFQHIMHTPEVSSFSLKKNSGRYHLWNLNLQRPVTVLWPTSLCYLNREHRASPSRQEALFCTPFFSLTDNRMALIRRLQRRRACPRVLGSRDPYQKLTTFYCNSFEISFLIAALTPTLHFTFMVQAFSSFYHPYPGVPEHLLDKVVAVCSLLISATKLVTFFLFSFTTYLFRGGINLLSCVRDDGSFCSSNPSSLSPPVSLGNRSGFLLKKT